MSPSYSRDGSLTPRQPMTFPKNAVRLPSDMCYLLKLPIELRLMIYRLLLIPQPPFYFLDPEIPNAPVFVHHYLSEPRELQHPLHTTILRTSRQINAEATSLLYTELILVVCPTDIVAIREEVDEVRDILRPLDPSYKVWKYDPRCCPPLPSLTAMSPMPIYNSYPLQGILYPHIFSRFQNIVLQLSLSFPNGHMPSYSGNFNGFHISPCGQIWASELDEFAAHITTTNLIRDFFALLSHSPVVSTLWITLDIHALIITPGVSMRDEHNETQRAMQKVADMKAAEIWLEVGILDPLKELKNVECAILNVRCPTEDSFATLQPKYAAIAEQLEDDIEAGGPMD